MTENAQGNDGEIKAVQEWMTDHDKPVTVSYIQAELNRRSFSKY